MKRLISSIKTSIRHKHSSAGLLAAAISCFLIAGCDDSVEYDVTETPSTETAISTEQFGGGATTLVLSEMPEGAPQTPTEIKEASGEAGSGTKTAIVAGRIDAGDMDPFLPGKLSFMISQLPDAGHADGDPDHADDCPFCKRKLENAPKAIVEFRDANGQVLDGNARSELGIELGDVVYVTGAAEFNPAVNTVMINAVGVYRAPSP